MTEEELHFQIKKAQYLSAKYKADDEGASRTYKHFAEFHVDYQRHSGFSDFKYEENLWENFKESETAVGNYWNVEFLARLDENEKTDWITKS